MPFFFSCVFMLFFTNVWLEARTAHASRGVFIESYRKQIYYVGSLEETLTEYQRIFVANKM